MVQVLGIAGRLNVHTLRVELEGLVGGIDGNGNRANGGHSLGQLLLITLGNVNESAVGGSDGALVEVAGIVKSLIGIGLLGVDAAVILDVPESVVHETAVAAVVAVLGGAIDQVLLGEGDQHAGLAVVLSLKGTGAGEGPAAAAVSLILDTSHSALVTPVHRLGQSHMLRGDEGHTLEGFISGAVMGLLLVKNQQIKNVAEKTIVFFEITRCFEFIFRKIESSIPYRSSLWSV